MTARRHSPSRSAPTTPGVLSCQLLRRMRSGAVRDSTSGKPEGNAGSHRWIGPRSLRAQGLAPMRPSKKSPALRWKRKGRRGIPQSAAQLTVALVLALDPSLHYSFAPWRLSDNGSLPTGDNALLIEQRKRAKPRFRLDAAGESDNDVDVLNAHRMGHRSGAGG